MKISELSVDSFGHWHRLRLPDLAPTVTVIHGPNEAGKSTLLQLIRAILYGYSPALHRRFVPPRYEGKVGGQFTVLTPQGRFQIGRYVPSPGGRDQFDQSELTVRSLDGSLQGRHVLGMLLAGVDESIFHNVFAVGINEMQHLGTLSDTEAARQLYGLVSGGERVSIAEVSRHLVEESRRLQNGGAGSLEALLAQRDQLRKELSQQDVIGDRWFRLQQQRAEITAEIEQLETRQRQFGDLLRGTQASQLARDHWRECRQLHGGLRKLGSVPKIPAAVVQRLQKLSGQLREHRQKWEGIRQQRRKLRSQAKKLSGATTLLSHGREIDELAKRRGHVAALAQSLEQMRGQTEELELELQGEFERIGIQVDWRLDPLPLLTDEMILTLREPADQLQNARERVATAQKHEQTRQAEGQRLQQQLESRLQALGQSNLNNAVQRLQRQSDLLRRRIELDNRSTRLQRKLKETRKESLHWIRRQVPSWRGLMVLGSVFTLGFIVIMVGLFGHRFGITQDRRGMMAVVGGAISLASVMMRNLSEWSAGRNLSLCRSDMDSLRSQLNAATQELEEIDRQLPPSSDPWAVQLQQNQEVLEQLHELQPIAEQQQNAETLAQELLQQREENQEQLRAAEQQWQEQLRALNLSTTVTPNQFQQLTEPNSPLDRLRRRLLALRQELNQKQSEWQLAQQQVERLWEQAELTPEHDALEKQIEELSRALKTGRHNQQQRDKLYRQWRQLSREQADVAKAAKRIREHRQQTLRKYEIDDPRQLKAALARRAKALELRQQRDARLKTLAAQLGECISLAELRKELENGDFENRLVGLESEQQQVTARLATLHERRGELTEQLKTLTHDRSAAARRLALQQTEQRLRDAGSRWQILSGIRLALDSVRRAYESDRQPETLAEASSYLKRLTAGRYPRIWTPFGESSLCVDDQQGKTWRVEALSRGTREQVYLSLRLALASCYARRGARLPMILDDVFVNFDAERSRAAAQTVCDFAAAGNQVLVFTCHDHIRDVFEELEVDLRCLPKPEEIAETGRPVLRETRRLRAVPIAIPEPVEETPAPEPVKSAEPVPTWPTDGDPDLDFELLYGVPEYDPGYGEPEESVLEEEPVVESDDPPVVPIAAEEPSAEAYLAGYRDGLRESIVLDVERRPPPDSVPPPVPAPQDSVVEYDHLPRRTVREPYAAPDPYRWRTVK